MKLIKHYINESILDDEDDIMQNNDFMVEPWLKQNVKIKGYYTIKDLYGGKKVIDVKGSVFLLNKRIKSIPIGIKFGTINGDFFCNLSLLETLQGCPDKVYGEFNCSRCPNLKSLEGAPEEVYGDFDCTNCSNLKSLEGAPHKVLCDFNCSGCDNLTDITNFPKLVQGSVHLHDNKSLSDLNNYTNPTIYGNFTCYKCKKEFTRAEVIKHFKVRGKVYGKF